MHSKNRGPNVYQKNNKISRDSCTLHSDVSTILYDRELRRGWFWIILAVSYAGKTGNVLYFYIKEEVSEQFHAVIFYVLGLTYI